MQGWLIFSFSLDQEPKKTGAGSRWELWWAGCCYAMLILLNSPTGMWVEEMGGPSGNEGLISNMQQVCREGEVVWSAYKQFSQKPFQSRPERGSFHGSGWELWVEPRHWLFVWSQDARTMREPVFRDLGHTVWPWRERTNCGSDKCSLLFWLEEKRGPKEYLFELF